MQSSNSSNERQDAVKNQNSRNIISDQNNEMNESSSSSPLHSAVKLRKVVGNDIISREVAEQIERERLAIEERNTKTSNNIITTEPTTPKVTASTTNPLNVTKNFTPSPETVISQVAETPAESKISKETETPVVKKTSWSIADRIAAWMGGTTNKPSTPTTSNKPSNPSEMVQPSSGKIATSKEIREIAENVNIAERMAIFNKGTSSSNSIVTSSTNHPSVIKLSTESTTAATPSPVTISNNVNISEIEHVKVSERINMLRDEVDQYVNNDINKNNNKSIITLIASSDSNNMASVLSQENEPHSPKSTNYVPPKNTFQILIEKLHQDNENMKEPSSDANYEYTTEIILNNSNILSMKEDNFNILATAMKNNNKLTNVELVNVNMKDKDCMYIIEAVASCPNISKLNFETNMLTTLSIEAIARTVECHPSLVELRISNQRHPIGIEAERALANALSQNTKIKKLSFAFRETFVATYVDKYLQRNIDYERKRRNSITASNEVMNTDIPYPFPNSKTASPDKLTRVVDVPIAPHLSSSSSSSPSKSKSETSDSVYLTPTKIQNKNDFSMETLLTETTENMSIQDRLAVIKNNQKIKTPTNIRDEEKGLVAERLSKLNNASHSISPERLKKISEPSSSPTHIVPSINETKITPNVNNASHSTSPERLKKISEPSSSPTHIVSSINETKITPNVNNASHSISPERLKKICEPSSSPTHIVPSIYETTITPNVNNASHSISPERLKKISEPSSSPTHIVSSINETKITPSVNDTSVVDNTEATLTVTQRLAMLKNKRFPIDTNVQSPTPTQTKISEEVKVLTISERIEKLKKDAILATTVQTYPTLDSVSVPTLDSSVAVPAVTDDIIPNEDNTIKPSTGKINSKLAAFGNKINLNALLPGAKPPPGLLNKTVISTNGSTTTEPKEFVSEAVSLGYMNYQDTKILFQQKQDSFNHEELYDHVGDMKHLNMSRATSFHLRTKSRPKMIASYGLLSLQDQKEYGNDLVPLQSIVNDTNNDHDRYGTLTSISEFIDTNDENNYVDNDDHDNQNNNFTSFSNEHDNRELGPRRKSVKIDLLSSTSSSLQSVLFNGSIPNMNHAAVNSSKKLNDDDNTLLEPQPVLQTVTESVVTSGNSTPIKDVNHLEPQRPISQRRSSSTGSASLPK